MGSHIPLPITRVMAVRGNDLSLICTAGISSSSFNVFILSSRTGDIMRSVRNDLTMALIIKLLVVHLVLDVFDAAMGDPELPLGSHIIRITRPPVPGYVLHVLAGGEKEGRDYSGHPEYPRPTQTTAQ